MLSVLILLAVNPVVAVSFVDGQATSPLTATSEHGRPSGIGGIIPAALPPHTSTWALLVCTSRYWFNYRHVANTLAVYRTIKRLGIPDDRIILFLADDMACNPRNAKAGCVYSTPQGHDLYGEDVEVDFRGKEVTAENLVRTITGRQTEDVPRNRRLLTDEGSNVLFYLTGHGGDNFLKFQDHHEIQSADIGDAIHQMTVQRRLRRMFFIAETCQASTLFESIRSPNVLAMASSDRGESSYSHLVDHEVGLAVVDRYTYYLEKFMDERVPTATSKSATMAHLANAFTFDELGSTPVMDTRNFPTPLEKVPVTEFFAGVMNAVDDDGAVTLPPWL